MEHKLDDPEVVVIELNGDRRLFVYKDDEANVNEIFATLLTQLEIKKFVFVKANNKMQAVNSDSVKRIYIAHDSDFEWG